MTTQKIIDLDMHCGECELIDYCGDPFGYAICRDSRFVNDFSNLTENEYIQIAEKTNWDNYKQIISCTKCQNIDDCYKCDFGDEQKDNLMIYIADYVYKTLTDKNKTILNKENIKNN